MNEIKKIIPSHIFEKIYEFGSDLEEIRLRRDKKLIIRLNSGMKTIDSCRIFENDIDYVINNATDFSVHTYMEQIKQGFITFHGHRVGISGKVVTKNSQIVNFSEISSLNIRIVKKNIKIDNEILHSAVNKNTLIISPPNMGKTSLLREIIRYLSSKSCNISIIDERFELDDNANLGDFVDFISGFNKIDSVFMMIKTMSPDYIVLDEITENIDILQKILDNGVNIIATIHGKSVNCIKNKNIFQFFDNFIEIEKLENNRLYKVKGSEKNA